MKGKFNVLIGEVVFCAVKVQDLVVQAQEVEDLCQAGLASVRGELRLQLVQRRLGTAAPLANQRLQTGQVVL